MGLNVVTGLPIAWEPLSVRVLELCCFCLRKWAVPWTNLQGVGVHHDCSCLVYSICYQTPVGVAVERLSCHLKLTGWSSLH